MKIRINYSRWWLLEETSESWTDKATLSLEKSLPFQGISDPKKWLSVSPKRDTHWHLALCWTISSSPQAHYELSKDQGTGEFKIHNIHPYQKSKHQRYSNAQSQSRTLKCFPHEWNLEVTIQIHNPWMIHDRCFHRQKGSIALMATLFASYEDLHQDRIILDFSSSFKTRNSKRGPGWLGRSHGLSEQIAWFQRHRVVPVM